MYFYTEFLLPYSLGALYLYRHTRRQALTSDNADELNGVRLSIPLSRIERFDAARCSIFNYRFSIRVPLAPEDATSDPQMEQTNKIQFITLQQGSAWDHLTEYIDIAKKRQSPDSTPSAIIDFGPLTFLENENSGQAADTEKDKESVIRRVLALGDETTLWSAFFVPSPAHI
jgi:sterol 3beta-glucosyltransferase